MSFKREGDNIELLNNLKDQRVRGLLSTHIPEEEAKLLSNGRLTCLICEHRPIFDNVTVLAVHRRGRRHLNDGLASMVNSEKEEVSQIQDLKSIAEKELSRYLKCKQEHDIKQVKEKQLKELQQSMAVNESEQLAVVRQENRVCPLLLSRRTFIQAISLGSGGKKCQILKQSGHKNDRKMFLDLPAPQKQLANLKKVPSKQSTSSSVQKYLKSLPRKMPIEKVIEFSRDNYGNSTLSSREETSPQSLQKTEMVQGHTVPEIQKPTPSPLDEKLVQHELQLRMSGWIKDAYGNWTKDPEVEFDSDEESVPPPLPP